MMASRGMGAIKNSKLLKKAKDCCSVEEYANGGTVNSAGNYTKPGMRKGLFEKIKSGSKGADAGKWSARKAQMLAREYKRSGGGYK
jgi:hypothetical protein